MLNEPKPNIPNQSLLSVSLKDVYRILDANTNRAGEGLRTLEEFARFILDDAKLTSEIKSIRHDLFSALTRVDRESLLRARDTVADVGTTIQAETEYERSGLKSVVAAAASRTQQSMRVLEEYGKTIDATASKQIEQTRYRTYTVTAALELRINQHARQMILNTAQLYVLIDADSSPSAFAETVKTLCTAGVDILQLRDRDQDDRTLFQRAQIGSRIANEHGTLFIVNDRADIAAAAGADGVHVGQDELPASAARSIVGPCRLVGVSTHDIAQVHQAIADGADYIGCGPVFTSETKTFDHYVGPEFLEQVHNEPKTRPLPAFAIGGITSSNIAQVSATGFHRVAVTGAIRDAIDKTTAIAQLKRQLSGS